MRAAILALFKCFSRLLFFFKNNNKSGHRQHQKSTINLFIFAFYNVFVYSKSCTFFSTNLDSIIKIRNQENRVCWSGII